MQSVMFRVEDFDGNVIYAEVRHYKKATYTRYVSHRMTQVLNKFPTGYAIYASYPEQWLPSGIYLNMTTGYTQEVRG